MFNFSKDLCFKAIGPSIFWSLLYCTLMYSTPTLAKAPKSLRPLDVRLIANVSSLDKDHQKLELKGQSLHSQECSRALKKLSLYEQYSQFVGVIKKSTYDNATNRIYLKLDSSLIPNPLVLSFIIPRIKREGDYPFVFDNGFLKGLKGLLKIQNLNNHCHFELMANWEGPNTPFSNWTLELIAETLTKVAMQKLMRIRL